MKLKFLIVLMTVLMGTFLSAAPLSSTALLRKLSLHLRGTTPEQKDLDKINSLPPEEVRAFLSTKTDEYLKSEEFKTRMRYNLEVLFRLKIEPGVFQKTNYLFGSKYNATDELFNIIIGNNESWDQLLHKK
jgi:hypothetical protein